MALLKSQPMLWQCLTGDLRLPSCRKTGRHWQLPWLPQWTEPGVYEDIALSLPRKESRVSVRKSPQHLHRGLLITVLRPVVSSHAPLIESSYMVMLRMATDHPCGSVLPMMESQCLSIGSAAQYTTFIRYF